MPRVTPPEWIAVIGMIVCIVVGSVHLRHWLQPEPPPDRNSIRQELAALQSALIAWVEESLASEREEGGREVAGSDQESPASGDRAPWRLFYNALTTDTERLELLEPHLDEEIFRDLKANSSRGRVQSAALQFELPGAAFLFPEWGTGDYPMASLQEAPASPPSSGLTNPAMLSAGSFLGFLTFLALLIHLHRDGPPGEMSLEQLLRMVAFIAITAALIQWIFAARFTIASND